MFGYPPFSSRETEEWKLKKGRKRTDSRKRKSGITALTFAQTGTTQTC